MVTVDVHVFDSSNNRENGPLEGAEFTLGEETEVTDAKGYCLFKNIKPGVYDVNIFKDGFGGSVFSDTEIKSTPDVQHLGSYGILKKPCLKLSADKTKIKKHETVTIIAQLFKNDRVATDIKQVSFSINGTQKVISDFDTDKEIAVMALKGSNQGKVKITAQARYDGEYYSTSAYSNVLFIQDGDEE